jgi:AraC-like DNA-binding protein
MDAAPLSNPHRALDSAVDTALSEPVAARFETREPSSAVRQMSVIYGPNSLQVPMEGPVDMCVRSFEVANLHIAHIRYGVDVVAKTPVPHDNWVFSFLRAGTVQRGRDRETFIPGAVGVASPSHTELLALSADCELVNLRVAQDDMRAACRALLGHEFAQDLRFDGRAEPGSLQAMTLARVMKHLAGAPRFDHPAARRHESSLRDAALFELLLGWPNNAATATAEKAAMPESTRRARDYIHAHAQLAPTVAEIAQAAGVGVRALALGFDKHFGMSPLRYLQQVRLDGVRAHLCSAPPGDTVTRIAFDWGFANLGVFAARYRERFGETPSETLRRHVH